MHRAHTHVLCHTARGAKLAVQWVLTQTNRQEETHNQSMRLLLPTAGHAPLTIEAAASGKIETLLVAALTHIGRLCASICP